MHAFAWFALALGFAWIRSAIRNTPRSSRKRHRFE